MKNVLSNCKLMIPPGSTKSGEMSPFGGFQPAGWQDGGSIAKSNFQIVSELFFLQTFDTAPNEQKDIAIKKKDKIVITLFVLSAC